MRPGSAEGLLIGFLLQRFKWALQGAARGNGVQKANQKTSVPGRRWGLQTKVVAVGGDLTWSPGLTFDFSSSSPAIQQPLVEL